MVNVPTGIFHGRSKWATPVPSHDGRINQERGEGGARGGAINQKGTLWGMPINVGNEARERHNRDGAAGAIQEGASILDAVASLSATFWRTSRQTVN